MTRLILAGNQTQALDYARAKGWRPKEYLVVSSLESLKNARGPFDLHLVRTYYERADRDRIVAEIMKLDRLEPVRRTIG